MSGFESLKSGSNRWWLMPSRRLEEMAQQYQEAEAERRKQSFDLAPPTDVLSAGGEIARLRAERSTS